MEYALQFHIEKRSLLIREIRRNIEKFIYEGDTAKDYEGGKFIAQKSENMQADVPTGHCIFTRRSGPHAEVIIGEWDQGKLKGNGIKLQKNNVAFCGSWANGDYKGNCVYFWHDESVQEGNMDNNVFNEQSEKVWSHGQRESGTFENDIFVK